MQCSHKSSVKTVKTIGIRNDFFRLIRWNCAKCRAQIKRAEVRELKRAA